MKRATYIGFLFGLVALVAALVPLVSLALTFTRGEQLQHTLSVCLKKDDAIEILKVHAKSGHEAAAKVWEAKDECATVPVIGPHVGKSVYAVTVDKDGQKVTAQVVEILKDGKVMGYFLTTAPVIGLKKERDS